jgi:hypothetical protein
MKRYIYLALLFVLLLTGCSPEYSPSSEEQNLVGNWIHDKTEMYANGALVQTELHSDPAQCFLNLKSSEYEFKEDALEGNGGVNCTIGDFYWNVDGAYLILQGISYQILTSSSTNLVIQSGSISSTGGGAYKYFYSK